MSSTETITEAATDSSKVAQAYLDASNAHEGAAVLATFDPAGTHVDPTLAGPISGEQLAGYVAGLGDVRHLRRTRNGRRSRRAGRGICRGSSASASTTWTC
jgi:hypothetical protein